MSTAGRAGNGTEIDDEEVLVIEGLNSRTYAFTRRSIKHMAVGAVLGFVLSLTLSSILYESAKNVAFTLFDILVLLSAAIALFLKQEDALGKRLLQQSNGGGSRNNNNNPINPGDIDANAGSAAISFEKPFDRMLAVVRIGGGICMFSAAAVLLIMATALPAALKLFLTMTVGTAHCFLLCLACVELFNRVFNNSSPLIARQLYTVALNSIAIGCLSGFMFGAADVENDYYRLGWEQWVTAALCVVSGILIGHANAYAANDDDMEIAFDALPMGDTFGAGGGEGEENNNNENGNANNNNRNAVMHMNDDPYTSSGSSSHINNAPPAPSMTGTLPFQSKNNNSGGVSLATINFPSASQGSLVPNRNANNNVNSGIVVVESAATQNNNSNNSATTEPNVPKPDW